MLLQVLDSYACLFRFCACIYTAVTIVSLFYTCDNEVWHLQIVCTFYGETTIVLGPFKSPEHGLGINMGKNLNYP